MKTSQSMRSMYLQALLFVALSMLTACLGTQTLTSTGQPIPHKVNTIVIHNQRDKQAAYEAIGKHLLSNGYNLKYTESTFLTIATHYKRVSIKKGTDIATATAITATIFEKNGDVKIFLSGTYRPPGKSLTAPHLNESTITHMGQYGSLMRIAWNELYHIASSYSSDLTFEIR